MAHHPARNHVIAGAFVLAMIAAAIAVLVIIGGSQSWFEPKQTLRIRFAAAPNLKVGNPVTLAGCPVGRVIDVGIVPATPSGEPEKIRYVVEVTAELPTRYKIHKDAQVFMLQSLVGQSAAVDIRNVGIGDLLQAVDYLTGRQASAFADAADELGIGEKEKGNIQEILENIRELTAKAKEDAPEILAKLKTTSENLEAASGKIQAILDENRDDVRQTVVHARGITEKVDQNLGGIMADVSAGAADLKGSLENLRIMTGDSKDVVVWNKGNLNKTLQNFKDTSEHLKALAQEVRRAPWRLFATPDKKEVESLNLYDAARQFATAASDLEGLADTLKVMMEAKEKGVEVDPEVLQGMVDRLQDTFNHYQETEEALWKEFERIKK